MAFAFPRFTLKVNKLLATLAFIALLVALSSVSFAQGTLGSIAGTVRDASGAVVPGATVTLKNMGTNKERTTTTSPDGAFSFPQIDNGTYSVAVERTGFRKSTYNNVQVLPGQQYSLTANLQVGTSTETVEVTAGQDLINTTSSEIAATVEQQQVLQLPLNGRNPIELIRNQAGVPGILAATRNQTTINGGRPGWTQLTQDGINIQDNFIRNNALDFVPNRPTSDTIAEFSVITNNPGADSIGGTSQVKLVTPSGTNSFHGSLYEYNRNSALAATPWFTKRNGVKKPNLNLNQFGGKISGPIWKNKLFFFGSYEGYRLRQQTLQNDIVPSHDDYMTGNYKLPTGPTVNVLNLINSVYANPARTAGSLPTQNLVLNPQTQALVLSKIRSASTANSTSCGDSNRLNTTCYSFNQSSFTNRDQEASRIDYNLNEKHSFEFVFQRFVDNASRNDVDNIHPVPTPTLSTNNKLLVGSWRWTITPSLLNEVRAGDNSSIVPFLPNQPDPNFAFAPGLTNNAPTLTGLALTSPTFYFQAQGRRVDTRSYMDNATWTKGQHNLAFGMSYTSIQPHTYNFANTIPTITNGFATATVNNAYNLTIADFTNAGFPGLSQSTVNSANAYAAFLSGVISQVSQTYQVKSGTSGFVAGEPNHRRYQYSIWAPYVQDSWRLRSNLTVNAGLKWEYWTPLSETDGIGMLPVITGNDTKASLLNPAGTVAPTGTFWHSDKKQFAPNVGFAWDPFSDGKTSIRGGYSLSYVNEDMVTAANNALNGNFGLVGGVTLINQTNVLSTTTPTVPLPTFKPLRTYTDQLASSGPTAAAFGIQQDLRTPYAHQFNFEIQRELKWDTAVYVRYVGTLGRDLWRGIDYNQQNSVGNQAFFSDFQRARSNLFLCGNPNFQSTCPQSQVLTFFPGFDLGGLLTNSTVQGLLRTGEVGSLADLYVTNRSLFPSAPGIFTPNPNIYAADALINGAKSNYHSMQIEGRRRMKNGLGFQINYTFAKLLSDANGNSQNRFEPFLDNNNPQLDYGRSEYDLKHVVNSNFIYELPFGKGRKFLNSSNGFVERVVGGWNMSSIIRWQSGNPFSILSGRGTINRAGRSAGLSAVSTLTGDQLKGLLGLREVNGLLYWINPNIINPTNGQAVGSDGLIASPGFPGQIFFNPQPGQIGTIKRLQFDGPASYTWDFSAAKKTRVTERIDTEFRVDFFNVLNSGEMALFGDYNVNSSSFGRITSALPPRIVQASLRINF